MSARVITLGPVITILLVYVAVSPGGLEHPGGGRRDAPPGDGHLMAVAGDIPDRRGAPESAGVPRHSLLSVTRPVRMGRSSRPGPRGLETGDQRLETAMPEDLIPILVWCAVDLFLFAMWVRMRNRRG